MSSLTKWISNELRCDEDLATMVREESLNADIAIQIYDARTEKGLNQSQLADLIGTSQSTIARLEDADYDGHSLSMLKRIATALSKDVRVRISDPPPDLDCELRSGGRLRDYVPTVTFSAERIRSTFPACIDVPDLFVPGLRGLLDADEHYKACRTDFESFAVPFVRGSMLNEIRERKISGHLPPKLGKLPIHFTELFENSFEREFNVARPSVTNSIASFDQFHFIRLPGGLVEREVLLFTKVLSEGGVDVLYLVQAHQCDHRLDVYEVYRLSPNFREGITSAPPLEVLKALVDEFGLFIRIGDRAGTFITNERVSVPASVGRSELVTVDYVGDPPPFYLSTMVKMDREADTAIIDCALVYGLNTRKYSAWLRKNGLLSKAKKQRRTK